MGVKNLLKLGKIIQAGRLGQIITQK